MAIDNLATLEIVLERGVIVADEKPDLEAIELRVRLTNEIAELAAQVFRWLDNPSSDDMELQQLAWKAQNPHRKGSIAHASFIPDLGVLGYDKNGLLVISRHYRSAVPLYIQAKIEQHNSLKQELNRLNAEQSREPEPLSPKKVKPLETLRWIGTWDELVKWCQKLLKEELVDAASVRDFISKQLAPHISGKIEAKAKKSISESNENLPPIPWLGTDRQFGDTILGLYKQRKIDASSQTNALDQAVRHFVRKNNTPFRTKNLWQNLKDGGLLPAKKKLEGNRS